MGGEVIFCTWGHGKISVDKYRQLGRKKLREASSKEPSAKNYAALDAYLSSCPPEQADLSLWSCHVLACLDKAVQLIRGQVLNQSELVTHAIGKALYRAPAILAASPFWNGEENDDD